MFDIPTRHETRFSYQTAIGKAIRQRVSAETRIELRQHVLFVYTPKQKTAIWFDDPSDNYYAERILAYHRLYQSHPDVWQFRCRATYDIYLDLVPGDTRFRAPCKPNGDAIGTGYGDNKFPYQAYRAMKSHCSNTGEKRPIVFGTIHLSDHFLQIEMTRLMKFINEERTSK